MVYHVLELYLNQKKNYREQRMHIGGMKAILGITYIVLSFCLYHLSYRFLLIRT